MSHDATLTKLREKFADGFSTSEFRDNLRVIVQPAHLYAVLEHLKSQGGFDLLVDITAADYLHYPDAKDRFGVMYALTNITTGERIVVKVFLNEPNLTLPTAFPLWKGADWMEREVYDMFGIVFQGHPNLRRILMPEEFTAYPLRKDYPMRGRGERHNFPVITRAES
jgi:NADH-quinone oxidoreductase subunit C